MSAVHASPSEQDLAVERLREAGPYAIPEILAELESNALTGAERAQVANNLGRLDRTAVPALIAALDSPDGSQVASAAEALGRIGDRRALPYLTIRAAQPSNDSPGRDSAIRAIAQITGLDFAAQPRSPIRVLTDEAWKYHRHQVGFPSGSVELWNWDEASNNVSPRAVPAAEAETELGLRMAREALAIDPTDRTAQAALLSLALQATIRHAGGPEPVASADATGTYATALASGPGLLADVLRVALADGHGDLAALATTALGRVSDRDAMPADGQATPLVEALGSPDRRVRFSAARALVELAPRKAFPGSSRVVPALTWFLSDPTAPRAVVIDGSLSHGNRTAAALRSIGYDSQVATRGDEGFKLAAAGADVELIVIDPTALQGDWRIRDTLTNLRADARTAGIPIFLLYPVEMDRELTRSEPIRPQSDVEPNNDQRTANEVRFRGAIRQARVLGSLDTDDKGGDYYLVGEVNPGTRIDVRLEFPPGSLATLNDVAITLEGANDRVVGQAMMGRLSFEVPSSDSYYIHVQAPQGRRGPSTTYSLLITLADVSAAMLANERTLVRLEGMIRGLPRIVPIALSSDPQVLKRQIDRELARLGSRPLTNDERAAYAQGATALLGRIAARAGSPFAPDLEQAGPALAQALNSPALAPTATFALADVPGVEGAGAGRAGPRTLAGRRRPDRRRRPARPGIGRFGPLTGEQEGRLLEQFNREARSALLFFSQVVGAEAEGVAGRPAAPRALMRRRRGPGVLPLRA
ncbi:MAG: HEAT repeat domain-containing protein [Isosphaeraceae bacterium]